MSCDFKPGDEVVCVRSRARPDLVGRTFIVERVFAHNDGFGLYLQGEDNGAEYGPPWFHGYNSRNFRKVQRRKTDLSIETFLTIKPGFEEPRRVTPGVPVKVDGVMSAEMAALMGRG